MHAKVGSQLPTAGGDARGTDNRRSTSFTSSGVSSPYKIAKVCGPKGTRLWAPACRRLEPATSRMLEMTLTAAGFNGSSVVQSHHRGWISSDVRIVSR
jgi:hypothetical protein